MIDWLMALALAALPVAPPVAPPNVGSPPAGSPAAASPSPSSSPSPSPPAAAHPVGIAVLWNRQRSPAPGPPQSIGTYSGGCLQGAKALPASGPGYENLHRSRNRYFGHPAMVDFIHRLGAAAKAQRLGVVIVGDLSQVRGGPTPTGHRSHQTGLDADIGYAAPAGVRAGHLKSADRERLGPLAVVDLRTHKMTPIWGRRVVRLLAAAASDPAVDRIFVNPAVRRTLCDGPARHQPWFARLRPWWGHHDHFHVRLKCPAENPLCQPQDPPAPEADEGCGATLAWWFSPDAQSTQSRKKADDEGKGPTVPDACAPLLEP